MGQASSAKMVLPGDKLIAVACHLTKRVNKAEELTYHFTKHALPWHCMHHINLYGFNIS
jgi:hypothetical protein